MSESDSESGTSRPGNREVAHRLFASEYDDATYSYSESDEERAPNYVVTPTGARVNRLFVVGVLTEVGQAGDSMLRARVADPTGAFVVYAGQYQPDAMAFLDNVEPPAFVAVTGKARTFQPEDSDRVFTSIRPETINEVDGETRDRWVVTTAERTLERIATVITALDTDPGDDLRATLRESGVDPSFAAGIPIALEQYGTTQAYLADVQRLALDATRLVGGEIDTVDDLALAPSDGDGTGSVEPAIDEMSISTPTTTDTHTTDTPDQSTASSEQSTPTTSPDETTTAQSQETETETEPVMTSEETTADQTESTQTESTQTEPTQTESTQTESVEGTSAFSESVEETPDEFDPEEFELDEEVRQEVESEYGTEFSTAAEVDSAGEAPIETEDSAGETRRETENEIESEPSFDDMSSTQSTFESDTMAESEPEEEPTESTATIDATTEPELEQEEPPAVDEPATTTSDASIETDLDAETDTESDIGAETASDEPLDTVLLETMRDLNDGDGADRATLVERVSEATGASDDAVEDAIEEALMSGQCYEPNDDKLKPI